VPFDLIRKKKKKEFPTTLNNTSRPTEPSHGSEKEPEKEVGAWTQDEESLSARADCCGPTPKRRGEKRKTDRALWGMKETGSELPPARARER